MRQRHRLLWATLLVGCSPDLPAGKELSAAAAANELSIEPPPNEQGASAVLRAVVRSGDEPIDASSCVVVDGSMGKGQLSQLTGDDVSAALEARMLPALAFSPPDAPGDAVIAPLLELAPGAEIAFACGRPAISVEVQIAESELLPILSRRWPPKDGGGLLRGAVWCGDAEIPPGTTTGTIDPLGQTAIFASGATASGIGAGCVRVLEAPDDVYGGGNEDAIAVPPLAIDWGAGATLLSPEPFDGSPGEIGELVSCEPDEVVVGPGCARVFDDRMIVRSPSGPRLWAIGWSGREAVVVTEPEQPFVIRPLAAGSVLTFAIETVDLAGSSTFDSIDVVTAPPMAHVVIHEVLANAKGPEPEQEWVELYNDGSMPADLEGWILGDVGGETVLPAGQLLPGHYALVVNEEYVGDGEYDPAPAEGTLILRVDGLGKNGLSNEGEPLKLVTPTGTVVSRFSDLPKPKAGVSVRRVSPDAPDGWEGSFALSAELSTPGAPNGPP